MDTLFSGVWVIWCCIVIHFASGLIINLEWFLIFHFPHLLTGFLAVFCQGLCFHLACSSEVHVLGVRLFCPGLVYLHPSLRTLLKKNLWGGFSSSFGSYNRNSLTRKTKCLFVFLAVSDYWWHWQVIYFRFSICIYFKMIRGILFKTLTRRMLSK